MFFTFYRHLLRSHYYIATKICPCTRVGRTFRTISSNRPILFVTTISTYSAQTTSITPIPVIFQLYFWFKDTATTGQRLGLGIRTTGCPAGTIAQTLVDMVKTEIGVVASFICNLTKVWRVIFGKTIVQRPTIIVGRARFFGIQTENAANHASVFCATSTVYPQILWLRQRKSNADSKNAGRLGR